MSENAIFRATVINRDGAVHEAVGFATPGIALRWAERFVEIDDRIRIDSGLLDRNGQYRKLHTVAEFAA